METLQVFTKGCKVLDTKIIVLSIDAFEYLSI